MVRPQPLRRNQTIQSTCASEADCALDARPLQYPVKSLASNWELIAIICMLMKPAQGASALISCFVSLKYWTYVQIISSAITQKKNWRVEYNRPLTERPKAARHGMNAQCFSATPEHEHIRFRPSSKSTPRNSAESPSGRLPKSFESLMIQRRRPESRVRSPDVEQRKPRTLRPRQEALSERCDRRGMGAG
jgi:hypothetical protein